MLLIADFRHNNSGSDLNSDGLVKVRRTKFIKSFSGNYLINAGASNKNLVNINKVFDILRSLLLKIYIKLAGFY